VAINTVSRAILIRKLTDQETEDSNYGQQIAFYENQYPSVYDLQFLQQNMFVIPVPFAKYHKGE
jgi:hypothetical protein